jgi:hypothetical protein
LVDRRTVEVSLSKDGLSCVDRESELYLVIDWVFSNLETDLRGCGERIQYSLEDKEVTVSLPAGPYELTSIFLGNSSHESV